MFRAICIWLYFLTFTSALTGCGFPKDYVQLMNLPVEQRQEEYRKLPLARQVDLYLIRASYSHPPDKGFAEDIALRGETAIPYLLERVEATPEAHHKEFLLYVFQKIHLNSVDLRKHSEVLNALSNTINKMQDGGKKEMCQGTLTFIKTTVPKYAKDYDPAKIPNTPPPPPPPPPK